MASIESSTNRIFVFRAILLARWKNAIHYFSAVLQLSASSFAASCKKTQRTVDLRKTFWPLCSDQLIVRAVGSRYLEKFSNGCAKWTFARHGTKCARPRNSFPQSFSFLSTSTFIFPFHTSKNGIGCSRKVSYKTIDTGEGNLARYNRTNRVCSCTNAFRKRKENSIISKLKKRSRFTLIIHCLNIF